MFIFLVHMITYIMKEINIWLYVMNTIADFLVLTLHKKNQQQPHISVAEDKWIKSLSESSNIISKNLIYLCELGC